MPPVHVFMTRDGSVRPTHFSIRETTTLRVIADTLHQYRSVKVLQFQTPDMSCVKPATSDCTLHDMGVLVERDEHDALVIYYEAAPPLPPKRNLWVCATVMSDQGDDNNGIENNGIDSKRIKYKLTNHTRIQKLASAVNEQLQLYPNRVVALVHEGTRVVLKDAADDATVHELLKNHPIHDDRDGCGDDVSDHIQIQIELAQRPVTRASARALRRVAT